MRHAHGVPQLVREDVAQVHLSRFARGAPGEVPVQDHVPLHDPAHRDRPAEDAPDGRDRDDARARVVSELDDVVLVRSVGIHWSAAERPGTENVAARSQVRLPLGDGSVGPRLDRARADPVSGGARKHLPGLDVLPAGAVGDQRVARTRGLDPRLRLRCAVAPLPMDEHHPLQRSSWLEPRSAFNAVVPSSSGAVVIGPSAPQALRLIASASAIAPLTRVRLMGHLQSGDASSGILVR